MATYTIRIKELTERYFTREEIESWFKDYNLNDYLTNDEINTINDRGTWSKERLAKKIIDHYYMREIGQETPALFKLYAKNKMNDLMEEYLPLIYSASISYDPLVNVDYTESFDRGISNDSQSTGNSNSKSISNSSGLNVGSDTPQGQISKQAILNGNFASQTNASESDSDISDNTNTSSIANSNTLEKYSKSVKGNSGVSATAQKMIEQYRQNIRAIDKEIIEKLNPLFMGLF